MNANSEFTWTTADTVLVYKLFVFHSSWILGQYERNIVLIYILRASSLSCHDKIILFRILRFFGVEESIWSGITNPFSDSPKEMHPNLVATFSRLFLFVLILVLCFLTLLIIHRKSKSHLVLSHLDMYVSTTIINSAIPYLLCVILVVWHNFKRLSLSATCYLASCRFAKLVGETCGSSANSAICGCKKLCKKIPKTTQKGEFCLTKILGNTITLIGLQYTLSRSPWPALSHSRQLFHSTGVLLPKELQSDLK